MPVGEGQKEQSKQRVENRAGVKKIWKEAPFCFPPSLSPSHVATGLSFSKWNVTESDTCHLQDLLRKLSKE